jgi:hypothetical protein
MYADYRAGMSLSQVGAKWHYTDSAVWERFQKRGFKLRSRIEGGMMNHSIVNKHGGVLNWRYKVTANWNELHLKLWFRDNGLVYPPWTMLLENPVGVWLCMSPNVDYQDAVASKARLAGCYARVTETADTLTVDMRPLLAVQR